MAHEKRSYLKAVTLICMSTLEMLRARSLIASRMEPCTHILGIQPSLPTRQLWLVYHVCNTCTVPWWIPCCIHDELLVEFLCHLGFVESLSSRYVSPKGQRAPKHALACHDFSFSSYCIAQYLTLSTATLHLLKVLWPIGLAKFLIVWALDKSTNGSLWTPSTNSWEVEVNAIQEGISYKM